MSTRTILAILLQQLTEVKPLFQKRKYIHQCVSTPTSDTSALIVMPPWRKPLSRNAIVARDLVTRLLNLALRSRKRKFADAIPIANAKFRYGMINRHCQDTGLSTCWISEKYACMCWSLNTEHELISTNRVCPGELLQFCVKFRALGTIEEDT